METEFKNALVLDVVEKSFKKDGKTVNYTQARVLDETNNLHTVSVPADFQTDAVDGPLTDINRLPADVTITIEERTTANGGTKIVKRLMAIR